MFSSRSGKSIAAVGGPDRTRTCDLRFRKPPLYPAELRDQVIDALAFLCLSMVDRKLHATDFATETDHFALVGRVIAV